MSNSVDNRRLTSAAVSERYAISSRTLYRWVLDKRLQFPQPVDKINNRLFFAESDLIAWERARAATRKAA